MSIKINTLCNWLTLLVSLVIGFLLTPIIIRYLGTKNYGIWSLIITIIGYYGLLDLGITSASLRYISLYLGKNDNDNLNKIINTSIILFSTIGFIVMILSLFLPSYLAGFFNIGKSDFKSFKYLIYLTGFTTCLMFPTRILSTIVVAHENWLVFNIFQIIIMLFKGFLSIIAVFYGYDLLGLGFVYAISSIVELLLYYFFIRKQYKHIVFSRKLYQKKIFTLLFSFGMFTMIIRLGDFFRFEVDKVIIGKALNMENVGVYAVAATLYMYLFRISVSTSGVLQPRFAFLVGNENNEKMTSSFELYGRILAVLIAGFGLTAFLVGKDFMRLWLPSSFIWIDDANLVLQIMIIGLVPDLMTSSTIHAMQALQKHQYYAYQTIIEGLSNLFLSIVLVKYYGIFGVALGTAIPCFFTRIFIQPIYSSKIIGISLNNYIINLLLKPALACVIVFLIINYSFKNIQINSFYWLFLKCTAIVILYFILSYLLCLNRTLRNLIKTTLLFR